eukprot:CAMPEP_0183595038 /NCGR_PEP_ID=MMETSP0371-20130417/172752_1 /TAXON_ID=268820 /ORGANISM="Peridinium aciculiferum, Strain PAER-2" /LENGTH=126 /DNA_ID=CAMNT_0025806805 /DNA_START=30 /DNA_END=406 /DNA_ORIENTATION=+
MIRHRQQRRPNAGLQGCPILPIHSQLHGRIRVVLGSDNPTPIDAEVQGRNVLRTLRHKEEGVHPRRGAEGVVDHQACQCGGWRHRLRSVWNDELVGRGDGRAQDGNRVIRRTNPFLGLYLEDQSRG